jgi:hypothetical protein
LTAALCGLPLHILKGVIALGLKYQVERRIALEADDERGFRRITSI